jgi:hypothetical protein
MDAFSGAFFSIAADALSFTSLRFHKDPSAPMFSGPGLSRPIRPYAGPLPDFFSIVFIWLRIALFFSNFRFTQLLPM